MESKVLEPVIEIAGCRMSILGLSDKQIEVIKSIAKRADFKSFVTFQGGVLRYGSYDNNRPVTHAGVQGIMYHTKTNGLTRLRIGRRGVLRELTVDDNGVLHEVTVCK